MKTKISLKKFINYLPAQSQESLNKRLSEIESDNAYLKRISMVGDLTIYKGEERIVLATITKLMRDRDNEVVISRGVDLTEYEKNPIILVNHNWSSLPVGRALFTNTYDDRIRQKIQFDEDEQSKTIFNKYKSKSLRSFSIGFIPLKIAEYGSPEFSKYADFVIQSGYMDINEVEQTKRFITKSILIENSVVTIPANTDAIAEAISDTEDDPETEEIETTNNSDSTSILQIEAPKSIEVDNIENKQLELESKEIDNKDKIIEEIDNKETIRPIVKFVKTVPVEPKLDVSEIARLEIHKIFGGI